MTDRAAGVDPQSPWPWLDPFSEDASHVFGGRDEDADALLRGVLASPVCVLFGRSGLGKTSLLLAGLFSRLRTRLLLPVAVRRLEYGPAAPGISLQLHRALTDAMALAQPQLRWHRVSGDKTSAEGSPGLWELLHVRGQHLLGPDARRWTPVFVLDQFEELFTLEADPERRRQIFNELGDLLENRVPPEMSARFDDDEALLDHIDLDSQSYRFVLSLREDFLPDLEAWTDLIPKLGPNRYRLLPLSDRSALQAICKTGGDLVDESSAQTIVQFLTRKESGHDDRVRAERRVEPALLSLVCASLNADRLTQRPPAPQLDVRDLERRGAQILDRFYDDAFAAVDPDYRTRAEEWVEENLITPTGSRRPYPHKAVDPLLIPSIYRLEQRRLVRKEVTERGDYIELVHDRLAGIALQRSIARRRGTAEAALLRQEKESAEKAVLELRAQVEQARAEDAVRAVRRVRKWMWALAGVTLLAIGLSDETERQRRVAFFEREIAERARIQAEAARAQAEAARIEMLEAESATKRQATETAETMLGAFTLARQAADAAVKGGRINRQEAAALLAQANTRYANAAEDINEIQQCPAGLRIYTHISEGNDRRLLDNSVTPALRADFIVAPVQVMPAGKSPGEHEVRYFRKSDATGANTAVNVLRSAGLTSVQARLIEGSENSTSMRPCHYELWLAENPKQP